MNGQDSEDQSAEHSDGPSPSRQRDQRHEQSPLDENVPVNEQRGLVAESDSESEPNQTVENRQLLAQLQAPQAAAEEGGIGDGSIAQAMPLPGATYPPRPPVTYSGEGPFVLPPVAPLSRVRLLHSYYFIFDNPNWILSLAVGFLCIFIAGFVPVAPYLLFGGYLILLMESIIFRPNDVYPVFTFDNFGEYMARAVWPFLVSLPFIVLMIAMYLGSYFGGIFGIIALANTGDEELIGLSLSIGLPVLLIGAMLVVSWLSILTSTMMLRSALTRSFREGFRMSWVFSYLRRTWVEHFVAHSFFVMTSTVLTFLGLFACCIGTYFFQAMSMMAYVHLNAQMYRVYVTRGGTPIAVTT